MGKKTCPTNAHTCLSTLSESCWRGWSEQEGAQEPRATKWLHPNSRSGTHKLCVSHTTLSQGYHTHLCPLCIWNRCLRFWGAPSVWSCISAQSSWSVGHLSAQHVALSGCRWQLAFHALAVLPTSSMIPASNHHHLLLLIFWAAFGLSALLRVVPN